MLWMQPRMPLAFLAVGAHCRVIWSFLSQQPQVFFLRAALNPFFSQPGFVLETVPTQVWHLAFGLVELDEVHTGQSLKSVQIPLDGISSLQCADCTTQSLVSQANTLGVQVHALKASTSFYVYSQISNTVYSWIL